MSSTGIIHASTFEHISPDHSQDRLASAIANILGTHTDASNDEHPIVLWSMTFTLNVATKSNPQNLYLTKDPEKRVVIFPDTTHDIAFDDTILDNVKAAWETVLGDRAAEFDFLRFEERRDEGEEEN